jgi:hypothetical protein
MTSPSFRLRCSVRDRLGAARMRLTFDRLWIWIAIALPALVALLVPLPAVDLAYQVRAGNEILATGAIPRMDTWTFTVAGTPWLDQQWLAQGILALGHRAVSRGTATSVWPARDAGS